MGTQRVLLRASVVLRTRALMKVRPRALVIKDIQDQMEALALPARRERTNLKAVPSLAQNVMREPSRPP